MSSRSGVLGSSFPAVVCDDRRDPALVYGSSNGERTLVLVSVLNSFFVWQLNDRNERRNGVCVIVFFGLQFARVGFPSADCGSRTKRGTILRGRVIVKDALQFMEIAFFYT